MNRNLPTRCWKKSKARRALLLVQDYHFALLPQMIKQARPDARVAIFWHIPWPNPEAFGICPWQRELAGWLLGADLVGFHTQAHCNNFLETVDAALESRIEWERFAVKRNEHTRGASIPDQRGFSRNRLGAWRGPDFALRTARVTLKNLGVEASFLGVGVDRVDYTKGIIERFPRHRAIPRKISDLRGKFTFVQIGAPSRTNIPRYHDFCRSGGGSGANQRALPKLTGSPSRC